MEKPKNNQLSKVAKLERLIGELEDDSKLSRNLRIIAGIITVLGVAASTTMKIMQAEKVIRARTAKKPAKKHARRLQRVRGMVVETKMTKVTDEALKKVQEEVKKIE